MTTIESIPHAFILTSVIGCWLVLVSAAAQGDPPSPETFNKPTNLVLTLSDDMRPSDGAVFSAQRIEPSYRNKSDKVIAGQGHKDRLNMNCGMNTNPYADSNNSLMNRLSGACDLTFNY